MEKVIFCVIFGMLAAVCALFSILQFREKGPLFNNAYIYASPEQRKTMNKKPHYRQSGIVFALLAAAFLFFGLQFLFDATWLYVPAALLLVATLVYAIMSSIKIGNK